MNAEKKTIVGPIPDVTSEILPSQIDATCAIRGGFGSAEREQIAQAVIVICQERNNWRWAITAGDIKMTLQGLGYEQLADPLYDLEKRGGFDGFSCPGVGDGRLLQKIADSTYAVTDKFVEVCYQNSPAR